MIHTVSNCSARRATRRHVLLLDSPPQTVAFDGTGMAPCVTLNTLDGAIELHGLEEIAACSRALMQARRLARTFGSPIPYAVWRRLHA